MSIEEARRLFTIDPEDGIIRRLVAVHLAPAGAEAGGLSTKGYRQICYRGRSIEGHRLAWALYYGEWPAHQIDHKNRIRDDNRKDNLRPATRGQNSMNSVGTSASGHKGVTWNKHSKAWMAHIRWDGKSKTLGHFKDIERAAEFRQLAADMLHGDYANHGMRA